MADMKEMKKLLIDYLYATIANDKKAMKELEHEFKLSEEQLEKLVKKFLDKWLQSPDLVAMLCELLGVYQTGEEESKGQKYYIG